MESATPARWKWLWWGNGRLKVRQRVGWRNSWTRGREFNVWVINLNFVSQWQFNLICCQPLLTKIRVLRSVCERSGEECEPVPATAKHDKSQLQQRWNAPRGEDCHAPQEDIDVKLLFNLCTLVTTNAKCYVRTDRLSLKGISRSVIYLIKMRIDNSSVYKVFHMKNSRLIAS